MDTQPICSHTLRRILGTGEEPQKLFCEECVQFSVFGWAMQSLPPPLMRAVNPGQHASHYWIPLDAGRFALLDSNNPEYPLPVFTQAYWESSYRANHPSFSQVGGVYLSLRQWVELPQEEPKFKRLVKERDAALGTFRSIIAKEAALTQAALKPELADDPQRRMEADAMLLELLRSHLVGSGFPATPGTARWLLAQNDPTHRLAESGDGLYRWDMLPTIGGLVVSLALEPDDAIDPADPVHIPRALRTGEIVHLPQFSSPWHTQELGGVLLDTIDKHRRFIEDVSYEQPALQWKGRYSNALNEKLEGLVSGLKYGTLTKKQCIDTAMQHFQGTPEEIKAERKRLNTEIGRRSKK